MALPDRHLTDAEAEDCRFCADEIEDTCLRLASADEMELGPILAGLGDVAGHAIALIEDAAMRAEMLEAFCAGLRRRVQEESS